MKFIEVKTAGNKQKLKIYRFYASAVGSGISSVPLNDTVCSLSLNAAVHAKQSTMYGFQVMYEFISLKISSRLPASSFFMKLPKVA